MRTKSIGIMLMDGLMLETLLFAFPMVSGWVIINQSATRQVQIAAVSFFLFTWVSGPACAHHD
jgi:hypothetical protein